MLNVFLDFIYGNSLVTQWLENALAAIESKKHISVAPLILGNGSKDSQMLNEQEVEFKNLADQMIDFLKNNGTPHTTIIIDQTHTEILEGVVAHDRNQEDQNCR